MPPTEGEGPPSPARPPCLLRPGPERRSLPVQARTPPFNPMMTAPANSRIPTESLLRTWAAQGVCRRRPAAACSRSTTCAALARPACHRRPAPTARPTDRPPPPRRPLLPPHPPRSPPDRRTALQPRECAWALILSLPSAGLVRGGPSMEPLDGAGWLGGRRRAACEGSGGRLLAAGYPRGSTPSSARPRSLGGRSTDRDFDEGKAGGGGGIKLPNHPASDGRGG